MRAQLEAERATRNMRRLRPNGCDGVAGKIGGEWLRYGAVDGDRLMGLRRGQRGTKATAHDAGSQVHVGRTIEFVVPILHAKDDWNG